MINNQDWTQLSLEIGRYLKICKVSELAPLSELTPGSRGATTMVGAERGNFEIWTSQIGFPGLDRSLFQGKVTFK